MSWLKPKKFKKKYGFSVEDIYALDYWIARELSLRLLAWLEEGVNSYPPDYTYEQWVEEIKMVADYLYNYTNDDEEIINNAKVAMMWIAVNLNRLWD